jgi:hypothetical protein
VTRLAPAPCPAIAPGALSQHYLGPVLEQSGAHRSQLGGAPQKNTRHQTCGVAAKRQGQGTRNGSQPAGTDFKVCRHMSRQRGETEIAKAYWSVVLDHSADRVWSVIRPFDHNAWAGVAGETVIEKGRKGDQVGSIRWFSDGSRTLRQILLAHSDKERCYCYAFCDTPPAPVQHYAATIRVSEVVETNQAFVEWWATFDCAPQDYQRLIAHFERAGFAVWLRGLRQFLATAD